MDFGGNNRKPLIFYVVIVIAVLMLLQVFVMPRMLQPRVTEVAYNEFIEMLDRGDVEDVQVQDEAIIFSTEFESVQQYYQTARMEDDLLNSRLLDAGVDFMREYPEATSPLLAMLFTLIMPLMLFVGIGWFINRQLQKRMGQSNALSFGKSDAKVYVKAGDRKTFEDVAGADEAKDTLSEVVDFLHNPKRYEEIGAKMPKGVLLVGPPGTGKTLLAQAVAGEANVPFFSISGSEFVQMFVGMGASKVRDLFKQANEKAPCIVFIDEIDTIGKRRDQAGPTSNDEREQTLNQLLSEMDGFTPNSGVVILAATNRPDSLDPALTRPGRFDRRVIVDLPDLNGREAILRVHARNVKMDPSTDFRLIARQTAGASGADLANLINEAALRAVRENHNLVMQEDLEESVDTVIAGQQKKNAVIGEEEKKLIAYHEVGHALVAAKQSGTSPVTKITIVPRTSGALGFTMQADTDDKYLYSKDELMDTITTLTGGRAAEDVVFNVRTTGASNDIEKATKLARSMITQYGMSDTFGMMALETQSNIYLGGDTALMASDESAAEIDKQVAGIIADAYEEAKNILSENIDKLHEISEYLIEQETITGKEFMDVLNQPAPATSN